MKKKKKTRDPQGIPFLDGSNNYLKPIHMDDFALTQLQFELHQLLETSFLYAVQITKTAILEKKPKIRFVAACALEPYENGLSVQAFLEMKGVQTTDKSWNWDYSLYHKTVDDVLASLDDEARLLWEASEEYKNTRK